jgi:hypothetical protein
MTGERGGTYKRTFLDVAIWAAGLVYLCLVLIVNLDSPLFGLLWIVLAGYELWEPHRQKRSR